MSDGLMQLLDPEAIVLGSDASTNEEIIRVLAGRLEALGYVKSSYADAVVRREMTIPTGLPLERADNVAVPHTDPEHAHSAGRSLGTVRNTECVQRLSRQSRRAVGSRAAKGMARP